MILYVVFDSRICRFDQGKPRCFNIRFDLGVSSGSSFHFSHRWSDSGAATGLDDMHDRWMGSLKMLRMMFSSMYFLFVKMFCLRFPIAGKACMFIMWLGKLLVAPHVLPHSKKE